MTKTVHTTRKRFDSILSVASKVQAYVAFQDREACGYRQELRVTLPGTKEPFPFYATCAFSLCLAEGICEETVKSFLWLLKDPVVAFSVCAGPTAVLKIIRQPVASVLSELASRCQHASELYNGKEKICRGRGQAPSSMVPWALSLNADLMSLLGINTGER